MNSKTQKNYIQALEAELFNLGKIFIKEKNFYKFRNGDLLFVRPDGNLVIIPTTGLISIVSRTILETAKIGGVISFEEVREYLRQVLSTLGIKPGSIVTWDKGKTTFHVPNANGALNVTFDGYLIFLNGVAVLNFSTGKFVSAVEPEAVAISQALQKPSTKLKAGDVLATKDRATGAVSFVQVLKDTIPYFENALTSGEIEQLMEVQVIGEGSVPADSFKLLTRTLGWG